MVVDDSITLTDEVGAITSRLEEDVPPVATQDRQVGTLKTIHGIGDITAMTLVAEVAMCVEVSAGRAYSTTRTVTASTISA